MTTFGTQILTGIQVLSAPFNLLALVVGMLAGAALGPLVTSIGISSAAALVLLMPLAAGLDPTMGLILLGACLVTSQIATMLSGNASIGQQPANFYRIPALTLVAGFIIIVSSAAATAVLQTATPADILALLICGAAAAILLAAPTHPAGWPAALALTLIGIAVQLSPLPPLDTQRASPLPLLFGLLVVGPAIVALAMPARVRPWISAMAGIELIAAVLPALLLGLSVTRGISVLTLNLGETGLAFGPRLITQRPKLVLAFVLTLFVAAAFAAAVRHLSHRVKLTAWQPQSLPHFDGRVRTRLAAGLTLTLAIAGMIYCGALSEATEARPLLTLTLATMIAAICAWFAVELAPLVTGLVLGQLMQQPLSALSRSKGTIFEAFASASKPLLASAVAASVLALSWPMVAGRLTHSKQATP